MLSQETDRPVVRGCGVRTRGGIYLETDLAEGGVPPHEFLICPPQPVDVEALGISPIGVQLIDIGGVHHVFDWVGSNNYPNVEDFLAELRRYGLSRRISRKEDFAKLTPDSRLMLLHSRAIISNAGEVWEALGHESQRWCPVHGFEPRSDYSLTCHALYAEVVEGGAPVEDGAEREVRRTVGSTSYVARRAPIDVEYEVGLFAVMPIGRLAVIRDDEGGSHEGALSAASVAGIPVRLEDQ